MFGLVAEAGEQVLCQRPSAGYEVIVTDTVLVRYIVDDVDAALAFYTAQLGFEVQMHPARASPFSPGARCG